MPGGLSTLVPAPLRRTNNEDDDAQRILAEYTYKMTSAPFFEICTSVLRLDVRFVVLALARSVEFRWKTVETVTSWHLSLDKYSVSVALLTNQLFVWVFLNSGPDLTKRVPSSDREREDLSIDVNHDSVQ